MTKKLTKIFFSVITKNSSWEILTKNLLYSEKNWRGINLAQDKNEIFGTDLIWRS